MANLNALAATPVSGPLERPDRIADVGIWMGTLLGDILISRPRAPSRASLYMNYSRRQPEQTVVVHRSSVMTCAKPVAQPLHRHISAKLSQITLVSILSRFGHEFVPALSIKACIYSDDRQYRCRGTDKSNATVLRVYRRGVVLVGGVVSQGRSFHAAKLVRKADDGLTQRLPVFAGRRRGLVDVRDIPIPKCCDY